MTNKHEQIDAAIRAAEVAVWGFSPETLHPWKREMARALIAHIADHMTQHITSPSVWMGYSIALDDLREIAGLKVPDAD
jgi:hypothetical protein